MLDRLAYLVASPTHSIEDLLRQGPNVLVGRHFDEQTKATAAKHDVEIVSPAVRPGSPSASVIVDRNQKDLRRIAKLVVRGKFLGLGRFAGNVDHVLVQEDRAAELLELIVEETKGAFGTDVSLSGDYGKLCNGDEVERVTKLVRNEVKNGESKVVHGGAAFGTNSYEPTIVEGASSSLLKTANKGPVLPVISFLSLEGALAQQNTS